MHARRLLHAVLAVAALATTARAQSPGTLTPATGGKLRYRWQRSGVTVELHDATKAWTQAEADLVKGALDKMPDRLLRKGLTGMDVKKFRRDVVPIALLGQKQTNASATTVIEEGYVSLGDAVFRNMDPFRVYATTIHEIGHCTQYYLLGVGPILGKLQANTIGTPGWTSISWTSPVTDGLKSWNGFVSDYARTNDREDFAESVEFYWMAPDELLRVSPAKFAFMRDKVFEGEVSPASSRQPGKAAIQFVKPELTKLGDAKASPLSVITITGNCFMGPTDGGFNTVRFGTTKAIHLSVSRSTIKATVPNVKEGSAPVTVQTQDGTTAPLPFEVKKPWWK
jgi:hypothetical protein